MIKRCNNNGNHWYSDHLYLCPWCKIAKDTRKDPFPDTNILGKQIALTDYTKTTKQPIYYDIPKLQINRDYFRFSVTTGTYIKDGFIIDNIGGNLLEGIISSNRKWLKFSKDRFRTVKTEDIKFDIDTLYPSGFMDKGIIEIKSNGGTVNIHVDISIIPKSNH